MKKEYIPPVLTVITYEYMTDEERRLYNSIVNKAQSAFNGQKGIKHGTVQDKVLTCRATGVPVG